MKKFLVVIAVLLSFVACKKEEPKPNAMCLAAKIGVPIFTNVLTAKLQTCDSNKLAEKILKDMNCEGSILRGADLKASSQIIEMLCPAVLKVISQIVTNELKAYDCDPKVISAFIENPKACELLVKKE